MARNGSKESLVHRFFSPPSWILEVEDRLKRDGRLGVNIGLEEGLILQSLCSLQNVEKVVEIGTQYGCSALWMAEALGEGGHIWTFEKDPQCIENARQTFSSSAFQALNCDCDLITGEAQETLKQIEDLGPFDLVFIDANKSAYPDYWRWAERHTAKNGVILVDNIHLFGSAFAKECPEQVPKKMWRAIQETLSMAFAHQDFRSSILPTQEGLLLSVRHQ